MLGTSVEVSVRLAFGQAHGACHVDQLSRTLRTVQGKDKVRFGHRHRRNDKECGGDLLRAYAFGGGLSLISGKDGGGQNG